MPALKTSSSFTTKHKVDFPGCWRQNVGMQWELWMNDEGIMLPECHSQWHHSKSNESIFRRQNYIISPQLLLGSWWWLTLRLSKGRSLLMTTVLLKTIFLFLTFPKLTQNYSRNTAHTQLLFSGGIFRLYNLFFQEAQNFADGNPFFDIFMEVSALTVENTSDLVSKVGK